VTLPVTPAAPSARRGFGIASLVLGILLVIGVALWLLIGSTLFLALVWIMYLVIIVAIVIAVIHLVVALLSTVFGVLAIVRDRGRVMGIVGIVLTTLATAVTVLVGFFFVETVDSLFGADTFW
jgi:hypothetical protein